MNRPCRSVFILAAWLLLAAPRLAAAAPIDLGAACGSQYPTLVASFTHAGQYPYRWQGAVLSGHTLTVSLRVVTPSGAIVYSGFRCTLSSSGLVAQPYAP
jgi:hypothetical protein